MYGDWAGADAAWSPFVPFYLVLGQGFDTDSDVTVSSLIKLVQGSNLVLP